MRDADENTWLFEKFVQGSGTYAWLGLNDIASENTFEWAGACTSLYANWNANSPSNSNYEGAGQRVSSARVARVPRRASSDGTFSGNSGEDCAVMQKYGGGTPRPARKLPSKDIFGAEERPAEDRL